MQNPKFKPAKLNDWKGDLSKQWFVYYSFIHPETKQFKRFKKVISMRLLTRTARHAAAAKEIAKINKWLREGNNPFDNINPKLTLPQALEIYLNSIEHTLRQRSFYTYRNYCTTLNLYQQEKKQTTLKIFEFTHDNAIMFMDWLKNTRKVSNRTYNNYRVHIKSIFIFLQARGYIDFNPFNNIAKLEQEESEITCLTPTELQIMKTKMMDDYPQLFNIAMLIFYCFLRPQEIVRLKVENIDLVGQRLYLSGKTSKNKKTQTITIPDPLLEYLVKLKNLDAPSNHYIFSRKLLPGTFQIAPTRIAEIWRHWCDDNGINKKIYHLKHTGVGMAIEAGHNVRDLQLQLRHSSLDETQKYLEKFNNVASDRLKKGFPRF